MKWLKLQPCVLLVVITCGVSGCDNSATATRTVDSTPRATQTVPPAISAAVQDALPVPDVEQTEKPRFNDTSQESPPSQPTNVSAPTAEKTVSQEPASVPTAASEDMRVRPRLSIRSGELRDLTFDDLEFEIEKDADFERSMLTDVIEQLDGNTIIIRGFILASSVFQQRGIKQFVLVRDNQQCCFGPGAYIYHNMQVEMEGDATANFSIRPVTVEGRFSIRPWIGPDGKCYSVYHVTATKVR